MRVIFGPNEFAAATELNKLMGGFIQKYGDFALEKFDAAECEFSGILAAVTSLPFLVEQKMVVIKNPLQNKQLSENIEELIAKLDDAVQVIFYEAKPDKRSKAYKLLATRKDALTFAELSEYELVLWVENFTKENGGLIDKSSAKKLIDQAGTNQYKLSNEIQKLLSYSEKMDQETIELLVDRRLESSIFDLIDACFSGRGEAALRIYQEQRVQKVEPQQIVAMLAWQLEILAIVAFAGSRSPGQIAGDMQISPYSVSKSAAIARKLSKQQVKNLVEKLMNLDYELKTAPVNADAAIKHFIAETSIEVG